MTTRKEWDSRMARNRRAFRASALTEAGTSVQSLADGSEWCGLAGISSDDPMQGVRAALRARAGLLAQTA